MYILVKYYLRLYILYIYYSLVKDLLPILAEKFQRKWSSSPVYRLLGMVRRDRNYEFDLRIAQWRGDHPSYFRSKHPIRIPNQRHVLVDCDKIDKDPKIEDLSVLSACGTGFGVTFDGKLGIVSHGSSYGGYFLNETDEKGFPKSVQRSYTGDHPEKGKELVYVLKSVRKGPTHTF